VIAAATDAPEVGAAEGLFVRARDLATTLEMRPLAAHCYLDLGKLYGSVGKHDLAYQHLAAATSMYREMDTPHWLAKAETELKKLGADSIRRCQAG
jgi:hypothetical protein